MTNAERQRRFRQRHPGYYACIQARKRAACKRYVESMKAAARAQAEQQASLPLPAPAEPIEIPGVKAITAVTCFTPVSEL